MSKAKAKSSSFGRKSSKRSAPSVTVTQWFRPTQKPDRVGVYEVQDMDNCFPNERWFALWNGERFGYRALGPNDAFHFAYLDTKLPTTAKWRGLAARSK